MKQRPRNSDFWVELKKKKTLNPTLPIMQLNEGPLIHVVFAAQHSSDPVHSHYSSFPRPSNRSVFRTSYKSSNNVLLFYITRAFPNSPIIVTLQSLYLSWCLPKVCVSKQPRPVEQT